MILSISAQYKATVTVTSSSDKEGMCCILVQLI